MTLGTYTTPEGYTLTAYSSLYLDYGICITNKDGETVIDLPCALSNEYYGSNPNPGLFDSWEEAEDSDLPDAFVPWGESEWKSCLASEADDLIEAYVPEAN